LTLSLLLLLSLSLSVCFVPSIRTKWIEFRYQSGDIGFGLLWYKRK
jgi:hypothetical protein